MSLAKEKLKKTGEADYIHIVQENAQDKTALILVKPIVDWYLSWENHAQYLGFRGSWVNKITQMYGLDIFGHNITSIL